MVREILEKVIQWTGDNRDEMISFCPDLLEYPYDYDGWPGINVIGVMDRRGNPQKIYMRDFLGKTRGGDYRIIRNYGNV